MPSKNIFDNISDGNDKSVEEDLVSSQAREVQRSTVTQLARQMLNDTRYHWVLNVMTIYILLADQVRIIFFGSAVDIFFNVMVGICFAIFIIDFVISLLGNKKYLLSFYFFFDIIMTLFIVFDFTFIQMLLFANSQLKFENLITRLFKIIRIIRIIRILKIIKT